MESRDARLLHRIDARNADAIRKYVEPTPMNARILAGLSREQAAKALRTTVYILTGVETGRIDVSLRVARAMEALYGFSMDVLFPQE